MPGLLLGDGLGAALAELDPVPFTRWRFGPHTPRAIEPTWLVDHAQRCHGSSDTHLGDGAVDGVGDRRRSGRPSLRGPHPVVSSLIGATVRAAEGLADIAPLEDAPKKRVVNAIIDQVADHLGNTRSICRNSYVHPAVVDAYLDGSLMKHWRRPVSRRPAGLLDSERRTLRVLR